MKISIAYIVLGLSAIGMQVSLDLFGGMKLSTSLHIIVEAFSASTGIEKTLMAFTIPAPLFPGLFAWFTKGSRKPFRRG
ncbi:hypothetical protein [Paenibacillus sp.]|uniref:hypothetical protein n=1 Tax=Paenibacillus sp. TaxID=58172 RepID=UPI002D59984A|nr:hypothetical protein [Paenibacillus sp.]HZG86796.1 hypothetical protein [Paenibacillus sp.]